MSLLTRYRSRSRKGLPRATVAPLTPEESAQVADLTPAALRIAGAYEARYPQLDHEISSGAMHGVILAVRGYRPDGGAAMSSYLQLRVRGAILCAIREALQQDQMSSRRGPRRQRHTIAHSDPHRGYVGDYLDPSQGYLVVSDRSLPDQALDYDDALEALCNRLPNPTWKAVVRLRARGLLNRQIGREVGLSESRVSQILAEIDTYLLELDQCPR